MDPKVLIYFVEKRTTLTLWLMNTLRSYLHYDSFISIKVLVLFQSSKL